MCKEFHCESGWLPSKGAEDIILDGDRVELRLLYPTEYLTCSCNPESYLYNNLDLLVDQIQLDLEGLAQ